MKKKDKLPIVDYWKQILTIVRSNQVTIIKAEPGAGKSTQVPQMLMDAGFNVVVTQPRRLAACTVAKRVADEWGCELGTTVGYQTAFESRKSHSTQCLFVTDGLALVRELLGKRKKNTILIIDEVHEWNVNIETLVAYIKQCLATDTDLKVVLMSATMETEELSSYFGGAPIISVPGRQHEIFDVAPSGDMLRDVVALLRAGQNTLVFLPGKNEVGKFCDDLANSGVVARILPLYAELNPEEQFACFETYDVPKCVVATNVAQTSITIPDIQAVVDSGMERRKMVVGGSEGLWLKPISFADSKQRRGRTGRCGKGIYIDYCPKGETDRLKYPQAEILRSLLDHVVLRLAAVGLDAATLRFFHQPDQSIIKKAKQSLKTLGCLDANGCITEIGKQVNSLPVSVTYARMVVEAKKLGVLSDIVTIASIFEVGGIIDRKGQWRKHCDGEYESDLIAQLMLYKKCEKKKWEEITQMGIHYKSLMRAREIRRHLSKCFESKDLQSTGDRPLIIKSICAGLLEYVFTATRDGFIALSNKTVRQLCNSSVVYTTSVIVGLPFDIDNDNWRLSFISLATVVEPAWVGLVEVPRQRHQQSSGGGHLRAFSQL